MNYHYFVSYEYENNIGRGVGNTDITTSFPLNSMKDIREVEKKIATKHGFENIVITNFIKF